ncbi:early nodulin-like protein 9 [Typha angustifolia]|uniref:early nodulin-like protein 9 n=1 Tax=Typha angustifolia TaxID=59011 RepID=UPI003C2DDA56
MAKYSGLILLCLVLLATVAVATEFKVGGSGKWDVPDSMSYNQWAEKHRFQVGDTLAFSYLPDKDSVLLVDVKSYNSCDTSSFIDQFNDGNTVFTFTTSGPFYFISGNKDNCEKNEKLHVVVMADRSKRPSSAPSPSPYSSSPPTPSGMVEITPSTSPPPPPNEASSVVLGFMGTLGAAIAAFFYAL